MTQRSWCKLKSYFLFLFLFFVKVLDYEIIKRDSTAMTHLWSVYKDDGEGSCDTYSSTKEKNCCDTWWLMDYQWQQEDAAHKEQYRHWKLTTNPINYESWHDEPRKLWIQIKVRCYKLFLEQITESGLSCK